MLADMGGGDASDLSATVRSGEDAGGVEGTMASGYKVAMAVAAAVVSEDLVVRRADATGL